MSAAEQNFLPQLMLTYDIRRAAPLACFEKLLALNACAAALLYDSGGEADEAVFQKAAEPLVSLLQSRGLPALIAENSAVCGRLQADGLHIEAQNAAAKARLAEQKAKYGKTRFLGFGNPPDRHQALEAGELYPDYLFFGKLGMDKKPAPHARNLALATWWAEIMQLDCVVQAGSSLEHLPAAIKTKAEFIAVEEMIFAAPDPAAALSAAQKLLQGG